MEYQFKPLGVWAGDKTLLPRRSQFKANYSATLELLERELLFLQAKQIVIQVDLPESKIRRDGLPRSGAYPDYQGIVLAFGSKYGPLKYATDVFDKWKDNLRAIALGLEALRKVDRYGITKRGEQYTGWKQLSSGPESTVNDIDTAAELIAGHSKTIESGGIIRDRQAYRVAYREAAMKLHPDKGGDQFDFCELQKAKGILDNYFN